MAYSPAMYYPYNQQLPSTVPQQVSQPANGLSFIDSIDELNTLQMPPGSTSQPFFLKSEDKFVIVTFDKVGGSTKELFSFEKIPMPVAGGTGDFVTREYFDQQIKNVMEAINGKHAVSEATGSEPAIAVGEGQIPTLGDPVQ